MGAIRPPAMRMLRLLLLALTAAACSASGRSPDPDDRALPRRTIAGVSARYQPAFRALRAAVESHEDESALSILRRLELRIVADLQRAAASEDGAAPGSPAARIAADALEFLRAFERILGGRARVQSLELALIGRVVDDGHRIRVVLRATSRHGAPLALRPGPSTLRIQTAFVNERGHETRGAREQHALAIEEIWVDPRGVTEVELGTFPLGVPPRAIAARTRWSLDFRAGAVIEGEATFPAMRIEIEPLERTVVAAFFPLNPVEPAELARYVEVAGATLAPIMERAVRIPPERGAEALDLLTPIVERSTVEELALIVPAIRWLARTTVPASDPLAWREWMRARARASGELGPGRSGLDIPDR